MSVRNVVRVMNFHALVRVDNAKKLARKYQQMQEELMHMMSCIANNRNFRLDKQILDPPEDGMTLDIYLGSDYGFCGNYNSQINDQIRKDVVSKKILIGKKLHLPEGEEAMLTLYRKELTECFDKLEEVLTAAVKSRTCRKIYLTYNHYENTSTIYLKKIQIYPVKPEDGETYTEDFAVEGNINALYEDMMSAYVGYELMMAAFISSAAENVLRQNATTESLKKIDEMEEEKLMESRREKREAEFKKVIDNFVKKSMY